MSEQTRTALIPLTVELLPRRTLLLREYIAGGSLDDGSEIEVSLSTNRSHVIIRVGDLPYYQFSISDMVQAVIRHIIEELEHDPTTLLDGDPPPSYHCHEE